MRQHLYMIKDLHFIGCGGNRVSQVEQFIVEDTIFEGLEGRGTALVLYAVTAASISNSSFVFNTHGSTFELHDFPPYANFQDKMNFLNFERDPPLAVGGALYMALSNISVANSKFTDNTAEIGGVLFAHNSCLHVVGSTYSHNRASFGGIMTTSESSVSIANSTFAENVAEIRGGVMITFNDSLSISGTSFTNNSAGVDSGVMETYGSQGRRQDFHGGVSEEACAKRARKKFQATPIFTIPSSYCAL